MGKETGKGVGKRGIRVQARNAGSIFLSPKRSQITIFIIIALIIVSVILIYFLFLKPKYFSASGSLSMEACMQKSISDSLGELGKQAGFYKPEFYYLYQGKKVGYLCYTNLYYKPCVNQVPFITDTYAQQLQMAIQDKVYSCYDSSLNELTNKGYTVVGDSRSLKISLDPGLITATLNAPVTLTKEGSQRFTEFSAKVNSPIYDILMIATAIVQQETKYGDSDIDSFMLFYPGKSISKMRRDDGTTVYSIKDIDTKTEFDFATRSFAWPAGYGYDQSSLMMQGDKG